MQVLVTPFSPALMVSNVSLFQEGHDTCLKIIYNNISNCLSKTHLHLHGSSISFNINDLYPLEYQ
jgi:hypothetical protein